MSRKSLFCLRAQNVWVRIFFFKCALNDYYSASSYLLNLHFKFYFLNFFFIFFINTAPTVKAGA